MARKIITVISRPREDLWKAGPPRDEETAFSGEKYTYQYPTGEEAPDNPVLTGWQSNEAPLKYLLNLLKPFSYDNGDRIICLCTDVVTMDTTWTTDQNDVPKDNISVFGYVNYRLKRFCKNNEDKGIGPWNEELTAPPIRLPANPNMEAVLVEIMRRIQPDDEVYLDVTGGMRDVNFILVLLMMAMQYQSGEGRDMVKSVVYSNLNPNAIHRMDDVIRIIRTINAMSELTTYGRTRLFKPIEASLDDETRLLIQSMEEMTAKLEVGAFSVGKRDEFIRLIDTVNDRLHAVANPPSSLSAAPASSTLVRQLIPAFQRKMSIGSGGNVSLASVVIWCVDNQMIQQGVTIFNENLFLELRRSNITRFSPGHGHHVALWFLSECVKCGKNPLVETVKAQFVQKRFRNNKKIDVEKLNADRRLWKLFGCVLFAYEFLRLVRNQMNHSILYSGKDNKEEAALPPDKENKEDTALEQFRMLTVLNNDKEMTMEDVVVNLEMDAIRKYVKRAAESLNELLSKFRLQQQNTTEVLK